MLVEETLVIVPLGESKLVENVALVPEAFVNVIWFVAELTVKIFVEVATVKSWEGVEVPMPILLEEAWAYNIVVTLLTNTETELLV